LKTSSNAWWDWTFLARVESPLHRQVQQLSSCNAFIYCVHVVSNKTLILLQTECHAGAAALGSAFMLYFFVALGASACSFNMLMDWSWLTVYIAIQLSVHLGVCLSVGYVFRLPLMVWYSPVSLFFLAVLVALIATHIRAKDAELRCFSCVPGCLDCIKCCYWRPYNSCCHGRLKGMAEPGQCITGGWKSWLCSWNSSWTACGPFAS
jgi:hypothetical protein